MSGHTRAEVEALAARFFPAEDPATVLAILDEYGREPWQRERERVQVAILRLSEGDADRLLHFIAQAQKDYRDVLYWSEYDSA